VTQLLDRNPRKQPFARADILSQMGETICLIDLELPTLRRTSPTKSAPKLIDEDPERWDGLS
jgi:hypothetical protein